jgi:hypothetical protein
VVVIVYDPGGSGTFYYIAAAISQNGSYKGTSGFLLGDRIAVKDVEIRKGVVFVQYADRRPAEPMSAPPLVDRSIQLILTGGRLSPVRPLIKQEKVRRMDPELDLYHEDGRHANPAGSYLTACVFYSILFKTTPEGLPGILGADRKKLVDLDGNQALFLQKAAFESTAAPCAARDE